jgi:hypothetical protein
VSKLTVRRNAVLVNVEVDKPPNNMYFRCHRDLVLDNQTVVRDSEGTGRTFYYITPQSGMRDHPLLKPRLRVVTLVLTVTWPSSNFLIWPVPLGERDIKAWKSARKAYELAQDQWMQMVWNETDYQVETAEEINHDPIWPAETFEALLKRAFDGKVIDNQDHPYVRRLRGILD